MDGNKKMVACMITRNEYLRLKLATAKTGDKISDVLRMAIIEYVKRAEN